MIIDSITKKISKDISIKPIRVGFVLHAMQVAGAEVLVREIIRGLSGRIEPTVLCLDGIGPLGEQLLAEGIPVVTLGRRPGLDWRIVHKMAKEIYSRRIEIIHAHQYTPFFYASLGKVLSGLYPKLILTEHGRCYPDVVSNTRRTSNRLVLGHLTDAITGVCEFSVRGLCNSDGFNPRKARVIENGIDIDRYGSVFDRSALKSSLGLDPGRRYVANIARHHPVKDQASLIHGFRKASRVRHDVDLLMVGDGPLRSELETLVSGLDLANRVIFLGVRDDVPNILRSVDLFALTSLSEAASLSLMEAMASGLPVVATDVGGNPELVRDEVEGLLVPRGDRDAIGEAILRILDDPAGAATMGAAGRATAKRRFQIDRTIENYMRLFYDVVPRFQGRRETASIV